MQDSDLDMLPTEYRDSIASLLGGGIPAPPSPVEEREWDGFRCFLKREDQNDAQTHKYWGIGAQLAVDLHEGARGFTLSSSGNAAL
ncbi:MAG: hypothetical protein KC561_20340, partial [Myxococcales bacterium]|nr:hypothetical protein [Myxococcales bacterium]